MAAREGAAANPVPPLGFPNHQSHPWAGMLSIVDLCIKQGADVAYRTLPRAPSPPASPSLGVKKKKGVGVVGRPCHDPPTWRVNPEPWVSLRKSPALPVTPPKPPRPEPSRAPVPGQGFGHSFQAAARGSEEREAASSSPGSSSLRGHEVGPAEPGKPGIGVGTDALMAAAFGGHMDVVSLLLRAKADIGGCSSAGENALMAAACGGHVRVAQHLHNSKADIHAVSRDGWDVLMFAAHAGNFETIKATTHRTLSPATRTL